MKQRGPLYDKACDRRTQFQIDTEVMRARDQSPEAVSSNGDDERAATEHMPFVSEPPARSGIKIVRKRTITKMDGGATVEQTAWRTIGDELVQCEFEAVYPNHPNLGRAGGLMGIFLRQRVERVRFMLAPEDMYHVGADTYIRKDLNYIKFGGKFLGRDGTFEDRLAVKPIFDKWGGWT